MTTLPSDPEGQNDDRAGWAEVAISSFQSVTLCDREDALADLIADLHHWADREGIDFDAELERGREHYREETRDA